MSRMSQFQKYNHLRDMIGEEKWQQIQDFVKFQRANPTMVPKLLGDRRFQSIVLEDILEYPEVYQCFKEFIEIGYEKIYEGSYSDLDEEFAEPENEIIEFFEDQNDAKRYWIEHGSIWTPEQYRTKIKEHFIVGYKPDYKEKHFILPKEERMVYVASLTHKDKGTKVFGLFKTEEQATKSVEYHKQNYFQELVHVLDDKNYAFGEPLNEKELNDQATKIMAADYDFGITVQEVQPKKVPMQKKTREHYDLVEMER